MTTKQMIEVVENHCDLGATIKVVKNGNNDYSVYTVCDDGLVEITIKN